MLGISLNAKNILFKNKFINNDVSILRKVFSKISTLIQTPSKWTHVTNVQEI